MIRPVLAALALTGAVACTGSLPWLHGELANHPAALIGQWVDIAKTSPSDSSLWVLEPNGNDGALRITHDSLGDRSRHVSLWHYGYWYVRGQAPGEEFCVNRRPGRDAPSCTRFTLDLDTSAVPPRRIIKLSAYAGAHHTAERLLIDRR